MADVVPYEIQAAKGVCGLSNNSSGVVIVAQIASDADRSAFTSCFRSFFVIGFALKNSSANSSPQAVRINVRAAGRAAALGPTFGVTVAGFVEPNSR